MSDKSSAQANGWAAVPTRLIEQCQTRKGALYVYCVLCSHDQEHASDWPSIDQLAKQCHMKADGVRSALRWLCAEGWVTREDRPGSTSVFRA